MVAKLCVSALFAFVLIVLPSAIAGQESGAKGSPASEEAQRLRKFFADDWNYWMVEYPEFATAVGYPGQNARWTDYSPPAVERRNQHLRESLKALEAIDRSKLPASEQLNYDLYKKLLENAIEGLRFNNEASPFSSVFPHNLDRPINQIEGVQQEIGRVIAIMPADNVADYQNIIARLRGIPVAVDQTIAEMQAGLKRGITPPKITMRDVPQQIEGQIFSDPAASPLLRAFQKFPASIPAAEQGRLRQEAAAAYRDQVVPAFRKLKDFLSTTYIPACRETISASDLPDGAAYYAYNVRWHTTTNLTPQQIHEIGLAEVKRIRAEMDQIIAQTGFQGSFAEFSNFLRTDPRFYYTDAASLVTGYRDIAKRADPQLAHFFGKLPRLPYGVKPVPDYAAPSQTTAYYEVGSPAAGRPGWYFVNTYDLKQRPKWEMEALTLHESVPGHHLQISLAQEQESVPEFRRHSGYTAFVEGWALYAESLGPEMGFYTDPYSKYGQLTYEMWRAVRLVVDTGMHAMGWSRDQAIDFFLANTSKARRDIIVEVDRYIVWPGQALGYKIGQMKITELRREAERELGERFSIRAFHDEVLGEGALPLDILEARVKAWIAEQKAQQPATRP
jgi:uncharacterized protein (DUF885 family)